MIKVNDYIEGYEYFEKEIREISGWVDNIKTKDNEIIYDIQADDKWMGHRGTMIFSSLGEVKYISSDKPRPEIFISKYRLV